MIFEQLDIAGKSMSLRGSGSINIAAKNADLVFIAAGPKLTEEPSMLKSLAEGMAPALVRVTVNGPVANPKIEKTALPLIQDTFSILGRPIEKE